MSNILVTGGLGVVGVPLVKALRLRGHHVHVADIRHSRDDDYTRVDVAEMRQVERLFRGNFKGDDWDYVYHMAAEFGRWNGEDYYEQMWRTNAIGTKNIIKMQERHGFKGIYFSSSEVYGDYGGVMSEGVMTYVPIRQLNDYALSKWVNEQQVLNSAMQLGTASVRVRLFNTYGPGEFYTPYRSVICRFIYQLLHGKPIIVHRGHKRTSTYIDDTVRTLANIADKGRFKPGEVYNIGGGELHTVEEIADVIVRAVFDLKYLSGQHAADRLVQYVQPEIMTTAVKQVNCDLAIAELDHMILVDLEEGIRRTVKWMREVYKK